MSRDIHSKPFDEGTQVKLLLFRDYIREWLPVFLAKKKPVWRQINIFDFFAGPGTTEHGDKGTPCLIINELLPYEKYIGDNKLSVALYLNEYDKRKFDRLAECLAPPAFLSVERTNLDFQGAFDLFLPKARNSANLLLLDQSGVKQINDTILRKIVALPTTDFLMFISSSTFIRFADHPAIKKHIAIPKDKISALDYYDIHRLVTEHFKTFIPHGAQYYLAPFSIKKGSNIYGLIFGTHHLLGLEKFLRACWRIDPTRGEANFDIDDDRISALQPSLFPEMDKPKKLTLFENELKKHILNGDFKARAEVREFALCSGFLPHHAMDVVRKLKKSAKLLKSL